MSIKMENSNLKSSELHGYEEMKYDETTKIISMPEADFVPHPQGIGHFVFHSMKKHGDKIAQIDVVTGEKELYSDFLIRCIRTAIELKTRGIKPKNIISVCSRNNMHSTVPYISAYLIGAIFSGIDPYLNYEDMKFVINDVYPKIIFVEEECEEIVKKIVADLELKIPIVVFGKNFNEFLQPKEAEQDFEPYVVENLAEDAVIVFSSGTTGFPKGIRISHNFLCFQTQSMKLFPVILGYPSLSMISMARISISVLTNGNIRIVLPDFDPVKVWDYIETYKIYFMNATPYQVIKFLENKPKGLISSLKILRIAGAHLSVKVLNGLRREMPKTIILYSYGQTEFSSPFDASKDIIKARPGSIGVPIRGMSYKIVDPETERSLGMYETGELRVKTKWCMTGYLNRDSSDIWDEEGFLKSGDIAYFDDKFCFYVVDRIKEMFKFRGRQYIPSKVENILTSHPEIKLAAVIGIPYFEDDNHAMALVVPIEGSKITAEEVEEYINGLVDDFHKIRAGVKIVDALPITSNYKTDRKKLKAMYVTNQYL